MFAKIVKTRKMWRRGLVTGAEDVTWGFIPIVLKHIITVSHNKLYTKCGFMSM